MKGVAAGLAAYIVLSNGVYSYLFHIRIQENIRRLIHPKPILPELLSR